MRINTVGKKIITSFLFLAIGVAVSSVETACDAKQDGQQGGYSGNAISENASMVDVTGKWEGETRTTNGNTATVILSIGPLKRGEKKTGLKYQSPRDCDLQAEYSKTENAWQIFSLSLPLSSSSASGYCTNLVPGNLKVRREKNTNRLSIKVYSLDGKFAEEGQLSKQ